MSNQPTLIAYAVRPAKGKGQKAGWTKIGAAWPHNHGNGLNIELDAFPVDGRIVLLEPNAETEKSE